MPQAVRSPIAQALARRHRHRGPRRGHLPRPPGRRRLRPRHPHPDRPVRPPRHPVPFKNASLQVVGGLVVLGAAWDDATGDCLAGLSGDEEAALSPGCSPAPAGGGGCRTSGPAARERGTASAARGSGAARAGGPVAVRSPILADTPAALDGGALGDAGHRARVAPAAGGTPMERQQAPEQAWPAADCAGRQRAGAAPGRRESAPRVSQDPERARTAGTSDRSVHALADPDRRRRRPGSPQERPDLARVPDSTGRRHHRLRLRPYRPGGPPPGPRTGLPRARQTPLLHT
ncbi:hypothetical protein SUDANB15_07324 [Streptomyces sp. enrichment culture]